MVSIMAKPHSSEIGNTFNFCENAMKYFTGFFNIGCHEATIRQQRDVFLEYLHIGQILMQFTAFSGLTLGAIQHR